MEEVVEAYRLDRYDNFSFRRPIADGFVVEAYRLDRYDNLRVASSDSTWKRL